METVVGGNGGGRCIFFPILCFLSALLCCAALSSVWYVRLEPHPYRQVERKESWLLSFGSGGGFESSSMREMRSVAEISPPGSNVFFFSSVFVVSLDFSRAVRRKFGAVSDYGVYG